MASSSSRVARASSSSICEIAKPTWIRTQSPGPTSSRRPMLTLRRTPATSTRASRFGSSTRSTIWPGMARHTATLLPSVLSGGTYHSETRLQGRRSGDDLAGIEQVAGVQRALDRPHHPERPGAVLELQERRLAVAHAVLAGAGAVHGDRAAHEAVVEGLRPLELGRVVRVHEDRQVEVAVADVADDRRDEAGGVDVALGLVDALGQPADRDAGVGGEAPG